MIFYTSPPAAMFVPLSPVYAHHHAPKYYVPSNYPLVNVSMHEESHESRQSHLQLTHVPTIFQEYTSLIVLPISQIDEVHQTLRDPLHSKHVILEAHPTVTSTASSQVFPTFNGFSLLSSVQGRFNSLLSYQQASDNAWDVLSSHK